LVDYLRSHQFEVETGIVDRPTAFRAEFKGDKPGPTIAYLAEYDALPGKGHGCGHKLNATMSTGAGIVRSKMIQEIGGKVIVLGTPAEETNGAKVPMSEKGIFNDVDVAMMVHPLGKSTESGATLAMDAIQFEFTGKSSHAAAAPEKGINALDGSIQPFIRINAFRDKVISSIRIHGIITVGSEATQIVQVSAIARFYILQRKIETSDTVVEHVNNIATGESLTRGANVGVLNCKFR